MRFRQRTTINKHRTTQGTKMVQMAYFVVRHQIIRTATIFNKN